MGTKRRRFLAGWAFLVAAAVRADGPYESDATVTEGWGRQDAPSVEIRGCSIIYQGRINADEPTYTFTTELSGGATLFLDEHAVVDNNATGSESNRCVNARPIYFVGSGLQDTVDHHPAFDADHSGFDEDRSPDEQSCGSGSWDATGMSSNYYSGVVYVTHHTRNLPSIHKLAGGSLNHTHHGLLTFPDTHGPVTWIVADNDQTYDGGIRNATTLTIVAEKDLTATGVNHPDAQVNFGSSKSEGGTLVKKGPGTLFIHGTQAWNPGALMRIEEGGVVIGTDPGAPQELYSTYGIYDPCQCLTLEVRAGGNASLLPGTPIWDAHAKEYLPTEDRNGFAAIENRGTITAGPGLIDTEGDVVLYDGSHLLFTDVSAHTTVTVGGTLTLDGTLTVDAVSSSDAPHVLMQSSGSLSGSFDAHNLPDGVSIAVEGTRVELRFDPTAHAAPLSRAIPSSGTMRLRAGTALVPVAFGPVKPSSAPARLTLRDAAGRTLVAVDVRAQNGVVDMGRTLPDGVYTAHLCTADRTYRALVRLIR
jgi:hypothetical protein